MNIKTGDTVMVIAGNNQKDVGKTGKVLKVYPSAQRIVVQGRNMTIRHTKPRKQGEAGGRMISEKVRRPAARASSTGLRPYSHSPPETSSRGPL